MEIDELKIRELTSQATSRVDLWRRLLQTMKARTSAEVGVWKGDFAKAILQECDSIQKYYMVDPWAKLPDWNKPFNVDSEKFEGIYTEAMQKTDFAKDKRMVLRGRTRDVIDKIPDNSLDFAYIDGDHTLRGITVDLVRVLPKVRDGGLLCGDDFHANPWQHDARFEPTLVCPFAIYFAEAMNLPIWGLPFNQFLIHKTSKSSFSFVDIAGKYGNLSLRKLNKLPPNAAVPAS